MQQSPFETVKAWLENAKLARELGYHNVEQACANNAATSAGGRVEILPPPGAQRQASVVAASNASSVADDLQPLIDLRAAIRDGRFAALKSLLPVALNDSTVQCRMQAANPPLLTMVLVEDLDFKGWTVANMNQWREAATIMRNAAGEKIHSV